VHKGARSLSAERLLDDGFHFFRWMLFTKKTQFANLGDEEFTKQLLTKLWEQVLYALACCTNFT
jgi:hypothetical protein